MANKSKILKKEEKNEFESRICGNMGNGFEWMSANWSILKITQMIDNDELIDPEYQRGIVWESPRKKALIETILRYGGNKIPTLTLRRLEKGKYELIDGKQRVFGSIKPFVDGDIKLNGVYVPELRTYNFKGISNEFEKISSAFLNTTIPVQIAENMSDEEAKLYFIQINESGVNMRIGEKIHAQQGTPLVKLIEEVQQHKVWKCIGHISRNNDYAYISRMLLRIRDYIENPKIYTHYTNTQLMDELQQYLGFNIPDTVVDELYDNLDLLYNIICKNNGNVSITDAFSIFLYIHLHHKKKFLPVKFGHFIKGFYENIKLNKGVFRLFNQQKAKYRGSSKYYEWYLETIDVLYNSYLNGADWDELSRLQVKA